MTLTPVPGDRAVHAPAAVRPASRPINPLFASVTHWIRRCRSMVMWVAAAARTDRNSDIIISRAAISRGSESDYLVRSQEAARPPRRPLPPAAAGSLQRNAPVLRVKLISSVLWAFARGELILITRKYFVAIICSH